MNIKDYIKEYKLQRQGLSFAFLAERVPTSENAPYRFNKVEAISPDDVVILGLSGEGNIREDNIRSYNGYLKLINIIKQQPELKGKDIRSVVAVFPEESVTE